MVQSLLGPNSRRVPDDSFILGEPLSSPDGQLIEENQEMAIEHCKLKGASLLKTSQAKRLIRWLTGGWSYKPDERVVPGITQNFWIAFVDPHLNYIGGYLNGEEGELFSANGLWQNIAFRCVVTR